jgi:hypothetical protein
MEREILAPLVRPARAVQKICRNFRRKLPCIEPFLLLMLCIGVVGEDARAEAPVGAQPPAPYSLPWQLRPAMAISAVRSDTSIAFHRNPQGERGMTTVTTFLGAYQVIPSLSPFARVGVVIDDPAGGQRTAAFLNPSVGVISGLHLSQDLRLGLFLGLSLPLGMGGGNSPSPAVGAALRDGVFARSVFDNALFAVNDFGIVPGVSLAYVAHRLTLQAEVTVIELIRVRGQAVQSDVSRTNLLTGVHIGYFVLRQLSFGADLRYQRWLSTPAAVRADPTGALRDALTIAVGARLHFHLRGRAWLRPGLSYTRGIDNPLAQADYNILQIDVPVIF